MGKVLLHHRPTHLVLNHHPVFYDASSATEHTPGLPQPRHTISLVKSPIDFLKNLNPLSSVRLKRVSESLIHQNQLAKDKESGPGSETL